MAGEGREGTFSFNRQIVRRAIPEAETSVVVVIYIWVQIRLVTQRKNLPNTHNRRHHIAAEWIFPTMVIRIQQQNGRRVATATTIAVHRAPKKVGKHTGPQVHHTGGRVRRGSCLCLGCEYYNPMATMGICMHSRPEDILPR